ncbi:MAG: hypothetical protein K8E24_003985 [Methanobacterium paludis]|nr:hypothetical protein [Methanobacterium paludis]
MKEITFYSSNNAWVNNGLMVMGHLMKNYEEEVDVEYNDDCISLISKNDMSITNYIAHAMQTLAEKGTYNFSTTFKILNNNEKIGSNHQPPQDYPTKTNITKKTIEINDKEREFLKKKKYNNSKNQQVWKMRMSYFGTEKNYLDIGLNFKDNSSFKKLVSYEKGKNICPLCGMPTKSLVDLSQSFNPIFGEHHNNEPDGISSDIRKKAKVCPKCAVLCYFALFDYYIPFYRTKGNKGKSYLSIPNTMNIEILRKTFNNLSLNGQYIDFSHPSCTSYNTNIKNLPNNSKSASLLTLLHNIKNKYQDMDEVEDLTISFEPFGKEEFKMITDWLFISSDPTITHIKSNEKIYEILEPLGDPKNGSKTYLVSHFLNKFYFDVFNENEVEKFFNGILTLDPKKVADGLFRISKESISNLNRMWVDYLPNNSSPLYLFTEQFLKKIMGESTMLEDDLKEACKSVAETIGKGFREDVGMLTKFAYSSGPNEFKKALEDASFRLAKFSALDKNKSFYLNANYLEKIMNSINQSNFSDAKTYFVSFMSAYVLSENYRQRKPKKE